MNTKPQGSEILGHDSTRDASPTANQMAALRDQYLNVMRRVLDGTITKDPGMSWSTTFDSDIRERGMDWPSTAMTMVGTKRLKNIRYTIEQVLRDEIAGDFVETGVWRGGASIFARAILFAYGSTDRKVICCDSFEGLPAPNSELFPADEGATYHTYPELAVSLEEVMGNFASFDLLDAQVVFHKGWFRDTMAQVASENIAVLRLDGDLYESTIDPLNALYDRIPDGGYVIVDDYLLIPSAKQAVHDFLDARHETQIIHDIDGVGVFFRKNEMAFVTARN